MDNNEEVETIELPLPDSYIGQKIVFKMVSILLFLTSALSFLFSFLRSHPSRYIYFNEDPSRVNIYLYFSSHIISGERIQNRNKRASFSQLAKDPFILVGLCVALMIVLRMPYYSLLWLLALVVMIGVFGWEVLTKKVKIEVEIVLIVLAISHLGLYFFD